MCLGGENTILCRLFYLQILDVMTKDKVYYLFFFHSPSDDFIR